MSIRLNSPDEYLVAERPMYFNYQGRSARNWLGGHDVVGFSPGVRSARKWYFAEGTTRSEFDEWITVLNPTEKAAGLTFRYMIEGAGEVVKTGNVAANSRATFYAADHVGAGKDISLLVESDQDIVAERPMYFNYNGWCPGGHDVVGYSE